MQNSTRPITELQRFLSTSESLFTLTGAGISAPSGLPTYRDTEGKWLYRKPIQHREFLQQEHTRKRYWARSTLGWPAVRDASPNPAHLALARLERQGRIEQLVTQNVDRLHQRAGSNRVIDLHGRLDRVRCIECKSLYQREILQAELTAKNPWLVSAAAEARPDGDRDLEDTVLDRFEIPCCPGCRGILMPDVVFFGGNIPAARNQDCIAALTRSDALLVIGSSLQVYSGYRLCRLAAEQGIPIAIINPGKTRADSLADVRILESASKALTALH
ncbi:NAD-dependent protein deacetylase [Halioglobus maricola]|uniref:protein acetyllysine N-acetyltransferase n=1 Tax=Halioglobus maricola TaxID=2601894 RepID=A0A5P9NKI9_9GAMM|nr:NAD-dependent protein deacetylase [Halioglobus maricola]QFU76119.1 NAD-dependent protein deacetylase [Halioglobus maricola]